MILEEDHPPDHGRLRVQALELKGAKVELTLQDRSPANALFNHRSRPGAQSAIRGCFANSCQVFLRLFDIRARYHVSKVKEAKIDTAEG